MKKPILEPLQPLFFNLIKVSGLTEKIRKTNILPVIRICDVQSSRNTKVTIKSLIRQSKR